MASQAKRGKMAPGSALEPVYAPESMRVDLKLFNTSVKSAKSMKVRCDGGSEIDLPLPLLQLLKRAASLLANGSVFVIRPYDNYVTQQQAADFLDSSKTVINSYIEQGKIQSKKDGDKSLISIDDLIKYKDLIDRFSEMKAGIDSPEFSHYLSSKYGDDGFPVSELELSELVSRSRTSS